jgi:protein TonB
VVAALLLSAAAHAGVLYWAASSGAVREAPLAAGGTVAVEVLLVQGPSEPAAARPAGAEAAGAGRTAVEAGLAADRAAAQDSVADTSFTQQEPPVPSALQHTPAPPDARPPDDGPSQADTTVAAPPPPPPKPDLPEPAGSAAEKLAHIDAAPPAAAAKEMDGAPAGPAGAGASSGNAEGTQAAAALADNPAPGYPYAARLRGQHGRVVLRVEVTPGGGAGAVAVERSSGYEILDRAASEAVRQWRFRPAHRGGVPVAATVQVPVRFDLR